MNTTELSGYINGLLLGDGYIDSGVTKRAFRIKSTNEDFIKEIELTLSKVTNFKIRVSEFEPYTDESGVNRKKCWELYVKAHPYFAKRYHHFYDDYRNRRITTKVINQLTPRGLANWYMSDGYIVRVGVRSGTIKDRRVEIATDRYKKEDLMKVQLYLEQAYGYKTSLIQRGKNSNSYRLRISLLDAQNFFLMINPYVVPSMKYKLNLCYDYQPKWMTDEYYILMKEIEQRINPNE